MSCILRIFQKKPARPPESEPYEVSTALEGPLPDKDFELDLLEQHLTQRLVQINKKANIAFANANYMHQKGDMKRYLTYLNERRRHAEMLKKVSARHMEVMEKRAVLPYISPSPPSHIPPTQLKLEIATVQNPIQKVPNYPSPPFVSSRPVGRTRAHNSNFLSQAPPHLRGRP